MLGNIQFIIHKVHKETGIPKEVLEAIYEEYWETFRQKITNSEYTALRIAFVGTFYADNTLLRGYIRKMIKEMRYCKKAMEDIPKTEEIESEKERKLLAINKRYDKAVESFRHSWQQLEDMRKLFIVNKEKARKNYEKRLNGQIT